jgi:aspartate/methionine/tyrosine aminotransferase
MYFPRGIIAQSAEAKKAGGANATIGMAFDGGKPLILSAVAESLYNADKAVVYAPTGGLPEVREAWKQELARKNPSLDVSRMSLPMVVPGITAGLSFTADIFMEENGSILASGPCWDNYSLIFEGRRGGALHEVPFLKPGNAGIDLYDLESAIREEAENSREANGEHGLVRILLNFPNNPAGYSPTREEAEGIADIIKDAADDGADILVIVDDAYFGFFYEDAIMKESLFSIFANLHDRVVAVKVDGPTKEDYVWGLRTAFVTFAGKGLSKEQLDALEKKYMGAIRSSVSCANTEAQLIMLKTLNDSRTAGEKAIYKEKLEGRYKAVCKFIADRPPHPHLKPLPFNSGYFMCFRCEKIDAEALRRKLLAEHQIGTIALGSSAGRGGYLRIAYSSLNDDEIEPLFSTVYDVAASL